MTLDLRNNRPRLTMRQVASQEGERHVSAYPQPAPQQPAPKRHRWVPWATGIGAFILGVLVGSMGGSETPAASSSPQPTVTVTTEAEAPETTEPTTPAAPVYGAPAKTDFKLTPKVLSKQCFGSAGCNLTFRIIISYTGPDLDPDKSYEVLYEVRGGEDGPALNKFTVSGDESSVDEEESIGTKSTKSKLTAVVTDVLG